MFFKKLLFFSILFIFLEGKGQKSWDSDTKAFIIKCTAINLTKSDTAELKSLVDELGGLISSAPGSSDQQLLSELYASRGEVQIQILSQKVYGSKVVKLPNDPPDELIEKIESDFKMAMELCSTCKCKYLQSLYELYEVTGDDEKLELTDKQIKNLGGSGDMSTYIGLGFNYIAPANIVGGEIMIMGAARVRQKKMTDHETGKKYRACNYEYPFAIGLFGFGYEISLDSSNYYAFKLNPMWFNTPVSVHPTQILYAQYKGLKSFIWRPEIGFSFSSVSINYAYNLPVKKQFDLLPKHMLSFKIILPVLKPRLFN